LGSLRLDSAATLLKKSGYPSPWIKRAMVNASDRKIRLQVMQSFLIKKNIGKYREPARDLQFYKWGGHIKPVYRTRFDKWEIDIVIEYDENRITADSIFNLLEHAGIKTGLGSCRPEKGGFYGMFDVKKNF